MLTLIEKPGKTRGHSKNQSGQYLLNLGAQDDADLFDDDYLNANVPQPLQTTNVSGVRTLS